MPEEKRLVHPLKWWQFYMACLRYAGSGVLGLIGDAATTIGLGVFVFKLLSPVNYGLAAAWCAKHGFRENLLIEIPLWFGVAILALRLLTAPFAIYREKPAPTSGLDTANLADRLRFLAGQITRFVDERTAEHPTLSISALKALERSLRDSWGIRPFRSEEEDPEATVRRYESETMTLYESRLAPSVLATANDVRKIGYGSIDAHSLADYPLSLRDIEAKAAILRKLATYINQAEARTTPRHLSSEQSRVITETLKAELDAYWRRHYPNDEPERGSVRLIALGTDSETLAYRRDFEAAFSQSFEVTLQTWTPGPREYDDFIGAVTMLSPPTDKHREGVWGVVDKALRAANLSVREAPYPHVTGPVPSPNTTLQFSLHVFPHLEVAQIVVGQRLS